jgi:ribosome-binding factor A
MRGDRVERVAAQFQQEIAMILQQELKDPSMGFVTITRVELSKDLSYGKVFYSCLGGPDERAKSQAALNRGKRFMHGLLVKRFRLKKIPALSFQYDESIENSIAMSDVLDQLKPPTAPDADG